MKSKFLSAFQAMAQEGRDAYRLLGDCILLEEIPQEEKKTKSGLVLAGHDRNRDGFDQNRPFLAYVLATGEGYYNDAGESAEEIPLVCKPGDIVLISAITTKWLSYFGPAISTEGARIGLNTAENIQMIFKGQEGYDKVYQILDSKINPQGSL